MGRRLGARRQVGYWEPARMGGPGPPWRLGLPVGEAARVRVVPWRRAVEMGSRVSRVSCGEVRAFL